MLDQAFEPLIDSGWIPSAGRRCLQFSRQSRHIDTKMVCLDNVPVMSATVLGLEMLIYEPYIDLKIASEMILSDVGATVQILRLVGDEFEHAAVRPNRMGECLASLDMETWFGSLSTRTFFSGQKHAATVAVWNHCHLIAQYSQLVAESINYISPEDAYLVGLLHEVDSILKVSLYPESGASEKCVNDLSEMEGMLPHFVLSALRSARKPGVASVWKYLLTSAHELAGHSQDSSKPEILDSNSMRSRPY